MKVQQLESALLRSLHGTFYLLLVEDGGQFARCLQIIVGTMQQALLLEIVADSLEVQRVQNACILIYLVDVGIDAILTYLVTHQGNGDVLGSLPIIPVEVGHTLVKDALASHPSVISPLGDEDFVFRLLLYAVTFLEGKSRRHVEMAGILRLHIASELVKELEVGLQLITAAHDTERRVIAIILQYMVGLGIEELSRCRVAVNGERPVGQFHLTVESHLVCHAESGFWRTPGVEAKMIEPILPGCGKHLHPTALVGRRCSLQWEDTALKCAAQENGLAVN